MNVHQGASVQQAAPPLLREIEDGIAVLTLNSPATRNALSEVMIGALHQAIEAGGTDPAVRAIVIAANGPAFSAGHDLKELIVHRDDPDRGRGYFAQLMATCAAMMQGIIQCPKPVIAAVNGIATAAGCQLVATCDLAVAASDASFGTPGVNIGLFCSTPMVALSRNIPRKQTMEMLLTGERITAETARSFGLINRVVAPGTEREEAIALGKVAAQKSMHVIKLGKAAFYRQTEMSLADAYRYTAEVMIENMMARDASEGINAFIEKRAPRWEDK